MSSCSSCNSAAQAYQQTSSAQSYIKQQAQDLQNPAKQANNAQTGAQPLNNGGSRGTTFNFIA